MKATGVSLSKEAIFGAWSYQDMQLLEGRAQTKEAWQGPCLPHAGRDAHYLRGWDGGVKLCAAIQEVKVSGKPRNNQPNKPDLIKTRTYFGNWEDIMYPKYFQQPHYMLSYPQPFTEMLQKFSLVPNTNVIQSFSLAVSARTSVFHL